MVAEGCDYRRMRINVNCGHIYAHVQKCDLILNPVPGLSPLNPEEVNKFTSACGEIQKHRNTLPLLRRDHVVMATMSTSVKFQMKREREIVRVCVCVW